MFGYCYLGIILDMAHGDSTLCTSGQIDMIKPGSRDGNMSQTIGVLQLGSAHRYLVADKDIYTLQALGHLRGACVWVGLILMLKTKIRPMHLICYAFCIQKNRSEERRVGKAGTYRGRAR